MRVLAWQARDRADVHVPAGSEANEKNPLCKLEATSVLAHRLAVLILCLS